MSVRLGSIDMPTWQDRRAVRNGRIEAGAKLASGKIVEVHNATRLMEAVVRPGDRVCLEGDNQKQAARSFTMCPASLAPAMGSRLATRPSGDRLCGC